MLKFNFDSLGRMFLNFNKIKFLEASGFVRKDVMLGHDSDPRFGDGWWQNQINMMLDLGKKAEQQSLAKYGLDFVTDTYLPEKLSGLGLI